MTPTSDHSLPSTALDGLRVLELASGIAGPLATMVLSELGADVIKIEPPGGDPLRGEPAFPVWARGKRSVVLDLKTEPGRASLEGLAAGADVVVTNFAPGTATRLGADYERLRQINPRLIVCSITGYGESGPYRDEPAYEALVAARVNLFSGQAGFRSGPVYLVFPFSSCSASLLAAQAILAALYDRERTGAGQFIETSLYAGALVVQAATLVRGEMIFASTQFGPLGATPVIRLYPCADGEWLMLSCSHATFWAKLAIAMDLAELVVDERFFDAPFLRDPDRAAALTEILSQRFLEKTRDEWVRILDEGDVPVGPVHTTAEFMDDPQVQHSRLVAQINDPDHGLTRQMAPLIDLSETPARISRPAPRLGEHNGETWEREGERAASLPPSLSPSLPLAGVRILDISSHIAGPMGPRLLADIGADVIKLEAPTGDPLRVNGASFLGWNRNKRGLVADLRTPEGREIAYRLVDQVDVIVENMRPGVARRLGMDYETLSRRNPRLIYVSVVGYGSTGPYIEKPGWDPLIQARAGMMLAQGGPANPPVYLYGSPTDYWAAQLGACGVCAALYARERSPEAKRGQHIESSLLKGGIWGVFDRFLAYEGMPPAYENDPDHFGPSPLHRLYETGEGWIFLGLAREEHWQALRGLLGGALAEDRRFLTAEARREHAAELAAALSEQLRARPAIDWLENFHAAGIPAAPLPADYKQAFFQDPHAQAGGYTASYSHPEFGEIEQTGVLVRFSAAPTGPGFRSPSLGEHTFEILPTLGYSPAEIAELAARGIIKG